MKILLTTISDLKLSFFSKYGNHLNLMQQVGEKNVLLLNTLDFQIRSP